MAPVDYLAATGTLTFAAGQTTKQVTVLVNGDLLDEANETYFLNLANAANATIADGQGLGTITNDDGPPSLSVNDVTVTEGDSGTTSATFTVTLAPASGQNVSVDYSTADGTATAPADYAATSGTLTFAPGQTTRTVDRPGRGRHAGRARRDVHGQPLECDQCGDRRRDRARHDPRRRFAAGALDQRRDGDRAGRRNDERDLHGQPQRAKRPRGLGRLRDRGRHGDRPGGLRRRLRQPQLRGRRDLEAGDRARQRRPARRGERDLLRQPLQSVERDDRRRTGRGHDHRQRPAVRRSRSTTSRSPRGTPARSRPPTR